MNMDAEDVFDKLLDRLEQEITERLRKDALVAKLNREIVRLTEELNAKK